MDDTRRTVTTAVAVVRVGYGSLMALAPRSMLRLQLGGDPSGPIVWLARAFGARDAVLGAGALLAPDDDARRGWVAAGASADAVDMVSALLGARWLGRVRSLVVAATAAGATAAGAWVLSDRSS
jgi:hypothetical protein